MAASLRSVPIYVLGEVFKQPALRKLPVYILHGVKPLPKGISPSQGLLDGIYLLSDTVFAAGELVLGVPEVVNEFNCNTRVRVTANKVGVRGGMWFYFNRVGLDRMKLSASFSAGSFATVHALLPNIRNVTGLALPSDDFYNDPIADGKVLLRTTANSYFFLPDSTWQIG